MDALTNSSPSNRRLLVWLALLALALLGLYTVAGAMVPFLLGGTLAYMGAPLVDKCANKGMGRTLAALVVLLGIMLLLLLAPLLIVPILALQLVEVAQSLPALLSEAWAWINDKVPGLQTKAESLDLRDIANNIDAAALPSVQNTLSFFGSQLSSLINLLMTLLITPFVTFFLLRDWPRLIQGARAHVPVQLRPSVTNVASIMDNVLGEFLRGQVSVMLVMAIVYSVLLSVAGTPFAIAIGTVSGLLSFIPFAGFAIGLTMAVLVTFLEFESWLVVLWTVVAMSVGTALESFWLTPKIVGDRIGLGPVAVLLALTVMGAAFGFAGVLLALPLASVTVALWRHYLPAAAEPPPDA